MTPELLDDIVAPNIEHLVLEDDAPLDNFQTEKQQRLLVEPLYSSWQPGTPFIAAAPVGIFSSFPQGQRGEESSVWQKKLNTSGQSG